MVLVFFGLVDLSTVGQVIVDLAIDFLNLDAIDWATVNSAFVDIVDLEATDQTAVD